MLDFVLDWQYNHVEMSNLNFDVKIIVLMLFWILSKKSFKKNLPSFENVQIVKVCFEIF